ncbi:MAG TPA: transposase [Longimicrobiaceae bacterium]
MATGAFERELMRRSPLAACVLEVGDYVFDEAMLASVWDGNRGRCYEDVPGFAEFLRLTRDALLRHGGSAHALFVELGRREGAPVDESNFYRKLSRTPAAVSRALLREGAARLAGLMPEGLTTGGAGAVELPRCFDGFEVVAADGKKVKDAAKRLVPARGLRGKLLGAAALVALDVRRGLAVAMSESLDGMANEVPLVPALMEQLRGSVYPTRPVLTVWDRQFDDPRTLRRLSEREGDAFVVRLKQKHMRFGAESAAHSHDARGRAVLDEAGVLGRGKGAVRVRRVTLDRSAEGEADVVLLTGLLDRDAFPAADLLALYRCRWGIEQVFQQVTETFSLGHLIGSSPKAAVFQLAYCLLLYDLVQLVKAYVAEDGKVLASAVSTYYLFGDVRRELVAWAYHTDGTWPRTRRDADQMRRRLRELLRGSWDPVAYTKAADKKPRKKKPPPKRLHGGYSSVQRVIEGRAKVVEAK